MSSKPPNVTFARSTDLWGQYVYQLLHSLQRQAYTYSTGTQVIYYFALKLATETRGEFKKKTWAQLQNFSRVSCTIWDTKVYSMITETGGSPEIMWSRPLGTILSYFHPFAILRILLPKIQLNIILLSTWIFKWTCTNGFPQRSSARGSF
jgi:hypothetical protein